MKGVEPARHGRRACSIRTCVVADIVYVPLETPLLAAARARGPRAVDGLGMLLHQAVPGFEKWFGVRPRSPPSCARCSSPTSRAADAGHRPHRLDRHGQVHGGRAVCARSALPSAMPMPRCTSSTRAPPCAPIEAAFPGTTAGGKVDRQKLAAGAARRARQIQAPGSHRASPGVRGRARRSCAARRPRAPPWRCWRSRCCWRLAASAASTSSSSCSAPAEAQRAARHAAARHDAGEARADAGAPDARCRKARAGRFRCGHRRHFRRDRCAGR